MKFHLVEDMYSAEVYVFVGEDLSGVKRHLTARGLGDYDLGKGAAGKCVFIGSDDGASECLIYIHQRYLTGFRKGDSESWAVLAHECCHAAHNITTDRGITDDNEPRAYFTDWLVEHIGAKLVKAGKR